MNLYEFEEGRWYYATGERDREYAVHPTKGSGHMFRRSGGYRSYEMRHGNVIEDVKVSDVPLTYFNRQHQQFWDLLPYEVRRWISNSHDGRETLGIAYATLTDNMRVRFPMEPRHILNLNAQTSTSFGRFLRRASIWCGRNDSAADLQEWTQLIYNELSARQRYTYEVLSGEAVRTAYQQGPHSCMSNARGPRLYAANPDVVKLLVIRSPAEGDRIIGRALVWQMPGMVFRDRVYPYGDHAIIALANRIARAMGWVIDANEVDHMFVTLKNPALKIFPYMDTLSRLEDIYPDGRMVLGRRKNTGEYNINTPTILGKNGYSFYLDAVTSVQPPMLRQRQYCRRCKIYLLPDLMRHHQAKYHGG